MELKLALLVQMRFEVGTTLFQDKVFAPPRDRLRHFILILECMGHSNIFDSIISWAHRSCLGLAQPRYYVGIRPNLLVKVDCGFLELSVSPLQAGGDHLTGPAQAHWHSAAASWQGECRHSCPALDSFWPFWPPGARGLQVQQPEH